MVGSAAVSNLPEHDDDRDWTVLPPRHEAGRKGPRLELDTLAQTRIGWLIADLTVAMQSVALYAITHELAFLLVLGAAVGSAVVLGGLLLTRSRR